jgi:Protein of unknown function (DUF3102)
MTAKPATGHNTKRSLDVIAAEIHQVERANIFAIGELLAEADRACEHGEWLQWLEDNFTWWSHDTALRYMAAYRLSAKYARVRNLRVPSTIIYDLGDDIDDPDLPTIIEALGKATKGKTKVITVDEAEDVIELTKLRIKLGDYPKATLSALDKNIPDDAEWAAEASEELKKAQPDTAEAADAIVLAHHRKHLEELFGGALPDWLDKNMLDYLDGVESKHRKQVLAKLQAATQPLDEDQVFNFVHDVRYDVRRADQDGDDAPTPASDEVTRGWPPSVVTRGDADGGVDEAPSPPDSLDAELLAALHVVLHHARRPMPTSVGGIKGRELVETKNFIEALHEIATGGSTVKRIADAAEARSRSGRATNGEGLTEWSES